jgi:hypothetical protein
VKIGFNEIQNLKNDNEIPSAQINVTTHVVKVLGMNE